MPKLAVFVPAKARRIQSVFLLRGQANSFHRVSRREARGGPLIHILLEVNIYLVSCSDGRLGAMLSILNSAVSVVVPRRRNDPHDTILALPAHRDQTTRRPSSGSIEALTTESKTYSSGHRAVRFPIGSPTRSYLTKSICADALAAPP